MNTENIVAGAYSQNGGRLFKAANPSTGEFIEHEYAVATDQQIQDAMHSAAQAFKIFRTINKAQKSGFLRAVAAELEAIKEDLIAIAMAESGLTEVRLQGELGRTTGQLRMFADLIDEGSWVDAIIETAIPDRKPMPRSDIRRMMVPIGPVVVFGASNFPLAFSVAGGDSAAAFAAGCPVVVKVHPAHPGTSALTGSAILKAVEQTNIPKGVFSMLYDDGHSVGTKLVQHPNTKAVAFTGSLNGGMALHKLAQNRPDPIPVFAEMGSTNPVFIFPDAVAQEGLDIASKFALSITNGAGQFCTKPGLLFAIESPELENFKKDLVNAVSNVQPVTMLTKGIYENYESKAAKAFNENGVKPLYKVESESGNNVAIPKLAEVDASTWLKNSKLAEEVFGPFALLIVAKSDVELTAVIDVLEGQLTTTVMAKGDDTTKFKSQIDNLADKAGRLVFNGVPTGVEVHTAINHGGPFPATNNQFTSVGATSIYRFVRPIAFQDWPNELLPDELKIENPLNIYRKVNNKPGQN